MAIYPKAKYRPTRGLEKDPPITPIGVILHVRDGLGDSLFNQFDGGSGIESHTYLTYRGKWEQYRDTLREADANYQGNSFLRNRHRLGFISVETEGLANGKWTGVQLEEIKEFLLWCNKVHGIPLQVCKTWDSPGIGYHIMFGSPGYWTPVAKSCPGPLRIQQFKDIIVPWLKSNPTGNEDDVNLDDKIEVYNPVDGSRPTIDVREALRRASYVYNYMKVADQREASRFAEIKAQTAAILTAMQGINKGVDPNKISADIAAAIKDSVAGLRVTLGPVADDTESPTP